ncbi:caspase domain-containing protein [Mycena vulgaris]|nr:caspase domain-containing protein [Mycena vulgaris]
MQSTPDPECRVFALIIGIDRYANSDLPPLKGCVNDAEAFRDYLTGALLVPNTKGHIKMLTNEQAKRAQILQTFDEHLIQNSRIRDVDSTGSAGDTIIFFFAGHGSRPESTVRGAVDSIPRGRPVYGIPHRTVNNLLRRLAERKGNNITVILDTCFSGGLTRTDRSVPRCFKSAFPIPADLDIDLFPGADLPSARAMAQEAPDGRYRRMASHVLLSACSDSQSAHETKSNGKWRGRFSESLERNLKSAPLPSTTYSDIIERVGKWPAQDPQVEGEHKGRLLFNSTYPSRTHQSWTVLPSGSSSPGYIRVDVGSVRGVLPGTEFVVEDSANNPVGLFRAVDVSLDSSELKAANKDDALVVPVGWRARVTNWHNNGMVLKVILDTGIASAIREGATQVIVRRFVENQECAEVMLSQRDTKRIAIQWLSGPLRKWDAGMTEVSLLNDVYIADAIDGMAHFNYFLNAYRAGHTALGVTIQLHVLEGESHFPGRRPKGENLIKLKNNIMVAELKEDNVEYGVTVFTSD